MKFIRNKIMADGEVCLGEKKISTSLLIDTGATSSILGAQQISEISQLAHKEGYLKKLSDYANKDFVLKNILASLESRNYRVDNLYVGGEMPNDIRYIEENYPGYISTSYTGFVEIVDLLSVPNFVLEGFRLVDVTFSVSKYATHNIIGMNILKLFDMEFSIGDGILFIEPNSKWKSLTSKDKHPITRICEQSDIAEISTKSNIKQVNAFNRPNIKS